MEHAHSQTSRFAVAPHDRGVAIIRAADTGLKFEVSDDGVRWTSRALSAHGAGRIEPICSAGTAHARDLFCSDASGRLHRVEADDERLELREPFQPVVAHEPWYEDPPAPQEMMIVRDARQEVYRAFFCARRRIGRDPDRRGCIGVAVSPDLRTWSVEPPVFAPNRFPRLFAPHVFSHSGRTFLFYSTVAEGRSTVRYARAAHLEGPFEAEEPEILCQDARTDLHTVQLGARWLVFFGRTADGHDSISRPGQLDFHADGRPFVRFYDALLGLAEKAVFQTDAVLTSSEILVRVLPRHAVDFRLNLRVRSMGAKAAGILFRTTMTGHDNMTLWLDFAAGALLLRRGVNGRLVARVPHRLAEREDYGVTVWAEGGFADIFIDDEWLLTAPLEGRKSGGFGLAVTGGEARFDAVLAQAVQPA